MKIKNFFVLLLSISVWTAIGFSIVHADDEDGEEDRYEDSREQEDEDDDDERATETSETVRQENTKPKMITKQIVDPPKTFVVDELQTLALADSDLDGIPDESDPHPDRAEIYFVSDANLNGIVDSFEK